MGIKYLSIVFVTIIAFTTRHVISEDLNKKITITEDAVIIEAAEISEHHSRINKRNAFINTNIQPYVVGPYLLSPANTISTRLQTHADCITSFGLPGKCTSFRSCYPQNKASGANSWDSWLVNGCNYVTPQGRRLIGVCCTNPNEIPFEESQNTDGSMVDKMEEKIMGTTLTGSENRQVPIYAIPGLASWPPPIPTHPPDHTIPPLPTHPPSPGYPLVTHPTLSTPKPTVSYPWQTSSPKPVTLPSYPWQSTTVGTTKAPASVPNGGCYQDQERIVGGHNADKGEWPWIAALFNGGRQFCGGSLIDNIHILSAAHCVAHMSSWDVARLTVRLGDYNIRTPSETRHIEKKVKRIVRHRNFDSRTLYNDIAIITMDSPVQCNQQIRPISLPSGSSSFSGQPATVIGWGSLREAGPQPPVLQEVNIPIWDNNQCRAKYGHAAPGGIVEHMLCAGQAGRDSCSGDSGGPLMINNGNKWTQVGIVSWGIGCGKGQYPGVYTRITHFLPWINKNLK